MHFLKTCLIIFCTVVALSLSRTSKPFGDHFRKTEVVLDFDAPVLFHDEPKNCSCDGREYYVPLYPIRTHPCGKYGMCVFDIYFYLFHVPNATSAWKSREGEFRRLYNKIYSWYGYPMFPSWKFELEECKREYVKCLDDKQMLVEAECERVKDDYPWQPRMPPEAIGTAKPYRDPAFWPTNRWRFNKEVETSFANGWKMILPKTKKPPTWDGSTDTMPFVCPSWLEQPNWTLGILLSLEGRKDIPIPRFSTNLAIYNMWLNMQGYIVRHTWCDMVEERYKHFYLPYNNTEFCRSGLMTGAYLCVTLNEKELDRQPRDADKECNIARLIPTHSKRLGLHIARVQFEDMFYPAERDP